MGADPTSLDFLTKLAQIAVAIVVGYIAWLARRDAKRNSISGLMKIVADQRKEYVEKCAEYLQQVLSPNSGFDAKPKEYKRIIIDQLEEIHNSKRGLDIAYGKLVAEADIAWNLGNSLQRQMEGMSREGDAGWNKLFADLRTKHL